MRQRGDGVLGVEPELEQPSNEVIAIVSKSHAVRAEIFNIADSVFLSGTRAMNSCTT